MIEKEARDMRLLLLLLLSGCRARAIKEAAVIRLPRPRESSVKRHDIIIDRILFQ